MSFQLTMWPALDGDCCLLSWGPSADGHHLLVDLGRGQTYAAVRPLVTGLANLELFVMSHIDADHIAGALPMGREPESPFAPRRVWFNGRPQLVAAQNRDSVLEPLSARQGEQLSRTIAKFAWAWNSDFKSEIVSTGSREARSSIVLDGGLALTLLSPTDAALQALLPTWDKEIGTLEDEEEPVAPEFEILGAIPNVEKLAATPYHADRAVANGSSIAFVAEYEGKRVLLAADAHSEVLAEALRSLTSAEDDRYRIDLLKVSHHGSRENTSPSFAHAIDCTRFAISTDGSRKHRHPHPETIARLLTADPDRQKTFYFNYRQPQTERWESERLEHRWHYTCVFPVADATDPRNGTLVVDI